VRRISPNRLCVDTIGIQLRILLVTDRPFIPAYDGSTVIYKAWLNNLRKLGHQVSVLSFNHQRVRWNNDSVQELSRKVDCLLIVNIHAGRIATALYFVIALIWRLISRRRHLPEWAEAAFGGRRYGEIRDFLGREEFDAVVVNKVRTTVLMGVRNLAAVASFKVLDIHDNFARRATRMRAVAFRLLLRRPAVILKQLRLADLGDLLNFAKEAELLREEIKILSLYDRVLFSSDEEAAVYANAGLPQERIFRMPWGLDNLGLSARAATALRPFDIGFIASTALFNFEGAMFLAEAILPRLKQIRPDVRVLIAGSICASVAGFFAEDPSVTLIPRIDHVEDFYSSVEVVVVPLLSGTGVSMKAMEAAWLSSAIVATTTGVRGLQLRNGMDFILAEKAEDFAAAVARLLADSELRQAMRQNASQQIYKRHSAAAFAASAARLFDHGKPRSGDTKVPPADVATARKMS
jgi:glycosyltransferase involved in cell wall biosynthesis